MKGIILILIMFIIIAIALVIFFMDKHKQKVEKEKQETLQKKYNQLDDVLRVSSGSHTNKEYETIRIVTYSQEGQHAFAVSSRERITIGRSRENVLPLNDGAVSSSHAVVYKRGNNLIVTDLNSFNGTFIDSKGSRRRIDSGKEVLISFNDTIQVGNTYINFSLIDMEG